MKKILITFVKIIIAAAVTAAVVGGLFILIGLYDASEFQDYFFSTFLTMVIALYWRLWDEKRKRRRIGNVNS